MQRVINFKGKDLVLYEFAGGTTKLAVFPDKIPDEVIVHKEREYAMIDLEVLTDGVNTLSHKNCIALFNSKSSIGGHPVFFSTDDICDEMLLQQQLQCLLIDRTLVFEDHVVASYQLVNRGMRS